MGPQHVIYRRSTFSLEFAGDLRRVGRRFGDPLSVWGGRPVCTSGVSQSKGDEVSTRTLHSVNCSIYGYRGSGEDGERVK